jgi:hypothetical protein
VRLTAEDRRRVKAARDWRARLTAPDRDRGAAAGRLVAPEVPGGWPDGMPAELAARIAAVCTPAEQAALRLKAAGYGRRKIADVLGISESAARGRLDSARRKLTRPAP